MRARGGLAAMEDLVLLLVAVVAFSLFFSAVAGSYVTRTQAEAGDALQEQADAFLAAVSDDPRWTSDRTSFLRPALQNMTRSDVAPLAGSGHFLFTVWNVVTDERWTFGESGEGPRRTAGTSGTVVGDRVDPARITVTVWA